MRRRTNIFLIGAAAAAIVVPAAAPTIARLAPLASTLPHHSGKSGIWGTVAFGGRPIKATQEIRRQPGGQLVATFSSSSAGGFDVALPPGRYLILQSLRPKAPGFLPSSEVTVAKGRYAYVDLAYDNGIR